MIKPYTKEDILREKIIKLALLQYKKEYIHGSNGPNSFDCAGLIWYVYNEILHINVYKNGKGQSTTTKIMTNPIGILTTYEENNKLKDLSIIKTGDILLFHRQSLKENKPTINNKYPGHCGIYLSNNYFIHCTKKTGYITIDRLNINTYWYRKLVGVKNIVSDQKTYIKNK